MTSSNTLQSSRHLPRMGVVVVTFQSADVIGACLASLLASNDVQLSILIVDNASSDSTSDMVRRFAARQDAAFQFQETSLDDERPSRLADITMLRLPRNAGYGAGVNRGIERLLADPELDLFWILNPDCEVEPDCASHFARAGADGEFALMGGRTLYMEPADTIQNDGGCVSRLTGVCDPVHLGLPAIGTPMPDARTLDFITGANCVASRNFVEHVGLMREDYFLYYEEVDWALRREHLPLRTAPQAIVRHHGGTTIGSGSLSRRPSSFANFLNFRSRMIFMRRFAFPALPFAYAYAAAKGGQLWLKGAWDEAAAVWRGAFGFSPPKDVAERLPEGWDARG